MLTKKITSKNDLIALLQQVQIRKIVGKDIESKDDLNELMKTATGLAQGNSKLTVFLISQ